MVWLMVSQEAAIKKLVKAAGTWRLPSKSWSWKTWFQGGLVFWLASWCMVSVLHTQPAYPQNTWSMRTRWKQWCLLWSSRAGHTPSFPHYRVGCIRQPIHCGTGLGKGTDSRRQGLLGPALQASYHRTGSVKGKKELDHNYSCILSAWHTDR